MFDEIVSSCRFLLQNFPEAKFCQDYLDKRLNSQSQELFQFGYFPSIENMSALISLVGEKQLYDTKLLFPKDIDDSFCHRTINFSYFDNYPLMLPYRDHYGNIIAIVARTLLSEKERQEKRIPKYKNTVFKKGNFLFGLFENKQDIIKQDSVYIVEGQFDVIKATENNFKNIVAVGNCHLSDYQFSLITRYTNNIFVLLDNDEAGDKGRKRIVDKFGNFANIRNFYLPQPYKDIDEYFSENKDFPPLIVR